MAVIGKNGGAADSGGSEWSGEVVTGFWTKKSNQQVVAAVTATVILLPHPPLTPPPSPPPANPPPPSHLYQAHLYHHLPPGAGVPGSPACRLRKVGLQVLLQKLLEELQQCERSAALTFGAVTLESVRARP